MSLSYTIITIFIITFIVAAILGFIFSKIINIVGLYNYNKDIKQKTIYLSISNNIFDRLKNININSILINNFNLIL